MKLHLCDFLGVPLYLHWSWFLMPLLVLVLQGPIAALILICVFSFVVLHEYGHVAAAQHYDLEVKDVTLYPIGGMAVMKFNPGDFKQEIVIALAGPVVNLVLLLIAFSGFLISYYFNQTFVMLVFAIAGFLNLLLFCFNMLPVFPMDGGRVLRGTLTWVLKDCEKATFYAVRFGQCACVGLGVFFLLAANPIAVLIFMAMFIGAQQELVFVQQWACLQRIKNKLADELCQPELRDCDLPQLIAVLEDVKNDELRQRFYSDELVPLLKDFEPK